MVKTRFEAKVAVEPVWRKKVCKSQAQFNAIDMQGYHSHSYHLSNKQCAHFALNTVLEIKRSSPLSKKFKQMVVLFKTVKSNASASVRSTAGTVTVLTCPLHCVVHIKAILHENFDRCLVKFSHKCLLALKKELIRVLHSGGKGQGH